MGRGVWGGGGGVVGGIEWCPPPASSYALYGERLGLLEEAPDAEAQRFIGAVETMLRTTLPLLFVPPGLVRWLNHRLWREHVAAWDTIFQHGESGISPRTPPTHGPAHRDKDRVGDGVRDGDGDAPGTPSPAPSRCRCRCRCAQSEGCPPQLTSASRASTRSSAWGGPAATRASWPSCCCRPSCPSTPSGPTSPSSPPAASTRCGGRGGAGEGRGVTWGCLLGGAVGCRGDVRGCCGDVMGCHRMPEGAMGIPWGGVGCHGGVL